MSTPLTYVAKFLREKSWPLTTIPVLLYQTSSGIFPRIGLTKQKLSKTQLLLGLIARLTA